MRHCRPCGGIDTAIVITQEAWLLQDTPGLEIGKPERKMGWNAQPTCAVSLDGVVVPESQRLGQEGQGFNIAMTACKYWNPLRDTSKLLATAVLASAAWCLCLDLCCQGLKTVPQWALQ